MFSLHHRNLHRVEFGHTLRVILDAQDYRMSYGKNRLQLLILKVKIRIARKFGELML